MTRRSPLPLVPLALVILASTAAAAQLDGLDGLGAAAGRPDLTAVVKEALRGRASPGVVVEKLDGGLLKVVVPLPDGSPLHLTKANKVLYNCSRLVDLFEPDLLGDTVIYDVAPIELFDYHLGWVTLHVGETAVEARSQVKTRGPGPDVNVVETLVYEAGAFNLFFLLVEDGFDFGVHKFDVKVAGAKPGKMRGHFCAGCTDDGE